MKHRIQLVLLMMMMLVSVAAAAQLMVNRKADLYAPLTVNSARFVGVTPQGRCYYPFDAGFSPVASDDGGHCWATQSTVCADPLVAGVPPACEDVSRPTQPVYIAQVKALIKAAVLPVAGAQIGVTVAP